MTDAELIARLRDLGDHAAFEPHMHHVAADRIAVLGKVYRMAIETISDSGRKRGEAEGRADVLSVVLSDVLAQLETFPIKHPQQAEVRARARNVLQKAALDDLARLGQEFDAETEAGGSIIQGLREAAEYTKGMLKEGGK